MKKPGQKSFNILLDLETYNQLTELGLQQQVSRGAVVRAAIRYHHAFLVRSREAGTDVDIGGLRVVAFQGAEPQLTENE